MHNKNKFLLILNSCIFIMLAIMTTNASAEYYLVDSVPQATEYIEVKHIIPPPPPKHHYGCTHHKRHYRHYVYVPVSYCNDCNPCGISCCYSCNYSAPAPESYNVDYFDVPEYSNIEYDP